MTEKEYLDTNEALMNAEMQLKREHRQRLNLLEDDYTAEKRRVEDEHKKLVRDENERYSQAQQRNMANRRALKRQYEAEQQAAEEPNGKMLNLDPQRGC